MAFAQEYYWIIALLMAVLSVWKTYTGPVLAAFLGFSYPEMLVFNVIPAMFAGSLGWVIGPLIPIWHVRARRLVFRPRLRRFLRHWRRYGYRSSAFLAPVLIGIPLYTLICQRLKQSRLPTFSWLLLAILLWSSLSYFCFWLLDLSEYLSLIQSMMTKDSVE
jgi:hypothetical protein